MLRISREDYFSSSAPSFGWKGFFILINTFYPRLDFGFDQSLTQIPGTITPGPLKEEMTTKTSEIFIAHKILSHIDNA